MNCKPLISGAALVEIERCRYDELVAQEEELRLIKKAISTANLYSEFEAIKNIFDIHENDTESEEIKK